MPFGEVAANTGAVDAVHKIGMAAKLGTTSGATVTFSVCVDAEQGAFGVNTYVPLAVLLIVAGDQVPTIPFGEVDANNGAVLPTQNGGMAAKFGVQLACKAVQLWVTAAKQLLAIGATVIVTTSFGLRPATA